MLGSGRPSGLALRNVTLTISNEEMNDIIEIINSLEESGLLIKGVSEPIKNKVKQQKGGFLSMLLGALGASFRKLGNKNITPVIYRIQEYGSIMCRCFRIGFINFMLKGKTFLDCTSLVSPNDY